MTFWGVVGAGLVALGVACLATVLLIKPLMKVLAKALRPQMGDLMGEVLAKSRLNYRHNPLGVLPVMEKMTALGFIETRMRAETGKPPSRPMGSPIHFSPWSDLLFYFANVYPMATPDAEQIDLKVVIGPMAEKPLQLKQPVLITAMSYGGALSLKARVALAKASAIVGTATNSGEGVFIKEEREAAKHYIIQYHRGTWPTSPQNKWEVFKDADAIELQISQGAQGAAPLKNEPKTIHPEMRRRFGLKEDQEALIGGRLKGVARPEDLIKLVKELKDRFPVPVGIKFGATAQMEKELPVYLEAGVDFLTIDGAEGGTHGGPPILQDDMGLPTLWAIARAHRFLEKHAAVQRVSLIAAGGLYDPGQFLKAIALGATACYSGTAIALSLLSDQMDEAAMQGEPPYALILQSTEHLHDRLDGERATENVVKLFEAWHTEWDLAMRAMGKSALRELSVHDLVARSTELGLALGIPHVAGPLLPHIGVTWQTHESSSERQEPLTH